MISGVAANSKLTTFGFTRPELEPMINDTRGAITPSMQQLFYENTFTYIIYNYMYTTSLYKYKTQVYMYIKYYKSKILAHFKTAYHISCL